MIRKATVLLCGSLLLLPITTNAAETHKNVQQALDWQLPENSCKKPPYIGLGIEILDEAGMRRRYDGADHYKIERQERKQKRFDTCMKQYRNGLAADFEELKSSAQYGLTKEQSDIILGKMASIHTILAPPENADKPEP